jgi:hypothetical protein
MPSGAAQRTTPVDPGATCRTTNRHIERSEQLDVDLATTARSVLNLSMEARDEEDLRRDRVVGSPRAVSGRVDHLGLIPQLQESPGCRPFPYTARSNPFKTLTGRPQ